MRPAFFALLGWVLASTAGIHGVRAAAQDAPLDADGCVAVAVAGSAQVQEAQARFREYRARLAEVEALHYPKLSALAFAAPMFTVKGSALTHDVTRRWKRPSDWGPYTRLEALLAQPLYSFGRAEAGEQAARHRAEVERARVREARNMVAQETRKLYYGRLAALSLQPALKQGKKLIETARERAQELYDEQTGDVTQVDLSKLAYAAAELERYSLIAADAAALALAALKHTMGLPETAPLALAHDRLPKLPSSPDEPGAWTESDLATLLQEAAENRPEWAQLEHGAKAALALAEAERLANWPVVFVAGQLAASWTPTRENARNPYHHDEYNELFGGVALGLKLDMDPAQAVAKVDQAEAVGQQVEALRRFAATGIPLQVRKAHQEKARSRDLTVVGRSSVKAARKWMTFAATAHASGTGEARDLIEGLVAYLSAKRSYYESLYGYYVADAELRFAVGHSS